MHKPAIAPLVFSRLFPTPKSSDPTNFQAHITRNLVPEVRSETVCFYGPIDCLEAQYPGLDYANSAHRVRLGRFSCHRKLFRVFDELRLSDHEIQTLCRWEGTRWARERYEKDEGVIIRDTTWDDVELPVHTEPTGSRTDLRGSHDLDEEEVGQMSEDEVESDDESEDHVMGDSDPDDVDAAEDESEDELQHSIGVELNNRLILATEARARGEEAVLDPDWEQWLKEAAERGAVPDILNFSVAISNQAAGHQGPDAPSNPEDFQPQPEFMPTPNPSASRARLSTPPPFLSLTQPLSILGATSPTPPTRTAM